VGAWYAIGVAAGLGAAIGLVLASLAAGRRTLVVAAAAAATVVAAALGYLFDEWAAVSGALGAILGAVVGGQLAGGAVARGGTRVGTALLVTGAAIVVAGLALVPLVGYVEVAALPVLAVRLRRRSRDTYAGLRILARD
jgi:hypothetical protein